MKRTTVIRSVKDVPRLKKQLLSWASSFKNVCWLDSNEHQDVYTRYRGVLAVDAMQCLTCPTTANAFQALQNFHHHVKDHLFGFLSYDLKNDLEALSSNGLDMLKFPKLFFFQPRKLLFLFDKTIHFAYPATAKESIEKDWQDIINQTINSKESPTAFALKPRIDKASYLKKAAFILQKIQRGDLYEMNFCQEFYQENIAIAPLSVYQKINKASQAPFACYFRKDKHYILSSSPERYLKKQGNQVISQPIKGTAARHPNAEKDKLFANDLINSIKEQAENTMIVDLVRNDLSKIAKKGSVSVKSLHRLHSFLQVHQLISTIACEIPTDLAPIDLLKATFPMGSMTGAPKIAAMQLIENTETTQRGIYSGSVGYLTPDGDFDFNVIIRSLLYNETAKYLSCSVGSAITHLSNPIKEWEECLVKIAGIQKIGADA